ncbi:type III pantothenate kinase [Noviherbaspirillum massiliense]|uniref:type III pantothenate kinase n=1 Tax=Noviherbaspirillum massiliense TaxID=1465823 RepID=UPI0003036DCB|nr:type III pantothenate kinase [Noviherbaspirillum massiliense]
MLLLVDAGNTRVKWAVPENASGGLGRWAHSGLVEHAQLDRLVDEWRGLGITRALLSNVAGAVMRERLQQMLTEATALPPQALHWFASVPEAGGVRNQYRNPAQLGCDRFASAIGAHALFPGEALIVATCGTATTVDAVTADGVFLGGMILPGLGLMASSLAKNTAQLPQIAQDLLVSQPFADHTDAAIASGCIAAQAGAIERAVQALSKRQAPAEQVRCVLSGGAAALIAPHLSVPHQRIDNLVLIGLQAFALTSSNSSC